MGKLNDKGIRAARVEAGEKFLADGDGLYLRIRAGEGSKVWFYRYTMGGVARKMQLGVFPSMGLNAARQIAVEMTGKRRQGIDPIVEAAAIAQAAEAAADNKAKILATEAARLTVKQLFERWERLELKARKDQGAEVRRSFEKDVLPEIGDVVAEDVKRSMIAACLDRVVERGAPIIARNLLGDLRQMFGFAIKREYVEHDPTSHLKCDDFGRKVERDRVLGDAEIKLLPEKLAGASMQETSIAAVWIMLSTCCRVGEISQARWEHIDLVAGTWWIPPANAKNSKEHTVVLSDFAKVHFQTLRRLVDEASVDKNGTKVEEPSSWVLPASHRDGHVCLKSLAKQIGDRQRGDNAPMKNRCMRTQALVLPKGKWTPHDLRRTGATLMGKLGVRPDVIEKCLNHVEQNRLVRIYQKQMLLEEQAVAWRLLGERLELLTSVVGNVIPLNRNAK
jgi:integrase